MIVSAYNLNGFKQELLSVNFMLWFLVWLLLLTLGLAFLSLHLRPLLLPPSCAGCFGNKSARNL